MLKKLFVSLSFGLLFTLQMHAVDTHSNTPRDTQNETRLKDEILREDLIDQTDVLAIPLDNSEVEDQELLDRLEGKPFHPVQEHNNSSHSK